MVRPPAPTLAPATVRRAPVLGAGLALVLGAAACRDGGLVDSGEPVLCPEPAAVEVGGGEDAFEPLDPGAAAMMIHGPQNGWHVLASARVHNFAELVTIDYTVVVTSGEFAGATISDNTMRVAPVPTAECVAEYPGIYGFIVFEDLLEEGDEREPAEMFGYETIELRLDVEDLDGRQASGALQVQAVPDPQDIDDEMSRRRP